MKHRVAPVTCPLPVRLRLAGTLALLVALPAGGPLAAGIDRWTPVGPEGGRISALVVDPSDAGVLLAGTDSGLWRSRNGGRSWRQVDDGLTDSLIACLAVAPSRPRQIYAGTIEGRVFKSTDGGTSWTEASAGLIGFSVTSLAVDPVDPEVVYAGTFRGLYKTTDGGGRWLPRNQGLGSPFASIADLDLDPRDRNTLYVIVHNVGKVFKTTNGAASWAPTFATPPFSPGRLTVHPTSPGVLYASTSAFAVLWRSGDGGRSWVGQSNEPALGPVPLVAVSPASPRLLFATGVGGVLRSEDGGRTWGPPGTGTLGAQSLVLDPDNPDRLYAGTSGGGVLRSEDGGAGWVAANRGLQVTEIADLVVDSGAPGTVYATVQGLGGTPFDGIYASREGGGDWRPITPPADTGDWFWHPFGDLDTGTAPPHPVYSANSGGIGRSTDHGDTWTFRFLSPCLNVDRVRAAPSLPTTLFLEGHVVGTFCGGSCTEWRSTDMGLNWECVGYFPLAIDPMDPEVLYRQRGGLERSDDGGDTWAPAGLGLPNTIIRTVTIDPTSSGVLYAGTDEGLFKSTDVAAEWEPSGTGLPPGAVHQVLVHPQQPEILYLRHAAGVFTSFDAGATWAAFGDGLPSGVRVTALAMEPHRPRLLYAATASRGVYRLTRRASAACVPGPRRLCLAGERFHVEVAWAAQGDEGEGQALPLTPDTGAFWFFRPENVELLIKILDGREINGSFWVFFGALSNVQYRIDITDSATGEIRTYFNRAGALTSRADTLALPDGGGGAAPEGLAAAEEPAPDVADFAFQGTPARESEASPLGPPRDRAERGAAACAPSPTALCLQADRFQVEVAWRDSRGRSGSGRARTLTPDTGLFWFFREENLELIVKLLDGRAVNGHFWFFSSALSNVAYTITVTDTATGAVRTYTNPQGTLRSRADTAAF